MEGLQPLTRCPGSVSGDLDAAELLLGEGHLDRGTPCWLQSADSAVGSRVEESALSAPSDFATRCVVAALDAPPAAAAAMPGEGAQPSPPAGPVTVLAAAAGGGGQLIQLPPGQELVRVGPGLYALRPVGGAAAGVSAAAVAGLPPSGRDAAAHGPQIQQPVGPQAMAPALQQQHQQGQEQGQDQQRAQARPPRPQQHMTLQQQLDALRARRALGAQRLPAEQRQHRAAGDTPPAQAQLQIPPHAGIVAAAAVAAAAVRPELSSSRASEGSDPNTLHAAPAPAAAHAAAAVTAAAGRGGGHKAGAVAQMRASSQRFRERQKELIRELEQEVVNKLGEMMLLAQENEVLRLRTSVLERAVEHRDEQISIIQSYGVKRSDSGFAGGALLETGAAAHAPAPSDGGACRGAAAAAPACAGGSDAEEGDWWSELVPSADDIKGWSSEEAMRRYRRFLHGMAQELLALQQSEAHAAAAASAPLSGAPPYTGPFAGSGGGGGGWAPTSGAPLEALRQEQQQMDAAGTAPPPGSMERIHVMCKRAIVIIKHVCLLNPAAGYVLLGLNLETGLPQPSPDSFWRGVVAQLQLTPKQVEDMLAVHELYSFYSNCILAERANLPKRLAGAAAPDSAAEAHLLLMRNTTLAMTAAEALARNFRKEHALLVLLEAIVWSRVLTPLQWARMSVFSYPLLPDVRGILTVAAEDARTLNPGSRPRPLVFALRAEHAHGGAARDAQARAEQLAAGAALAGAAAADGGRGGGGGGVGGGGGGGGGVGAAAAAAPFEPVLAALRDTTAAGGGEGDGVGVGAALPAAQEAELSGANLPPLAQAAVGPT